MPARVGRSTGGAGCTNKGQKTLRVPEKAAAARAGKGKGGPRAPGCAGRGAKMSGAQFLTGHWML